MDVIHGFVLAGGLSRRMGQCKALLRHPEDRPMVSVVRDVLAPVCRTVSIILKPGQRDETWPIEHRYLEESPGLPNHPLSGVYTGLLGLSAGEWGLFAPCDVPYIKSTTLQRMLDAQKRSQWGVVATDGDHTHPLIAVIPAMMVDAVRQHLESGDSARRMVRDFERVTVTSSELSNLNTMQDLCS